MRKDRVEFANPEGLRLAAILEQPDRDTKACALFAHCFTCGKDLRSAHRISRALNEEGIAVLRFDFTGLGESEGDFAQTGFSSNVADLVAAASYMTGIGRPPAVLIGHSLGGTAVLRAAAGIPSAKAVATIGAPAEPAFVTGLLAGSVEDIDREGGVEVNIGGRPFTLSSRFMADLRSQSMEEAVRELRRALMIFHSPADEIVGISNAAEIYKSALHPKSFVSLDDADHLLSRSSDAEYVARVLAAWAARYV